MVPGISFPGIPPGETFTYRYTVRQNGTYRYHSHSGLQEQLGHYGQLVVGPAAPDPVAYDVEHSELVNQSPAVARAPFGRPSPGAATLE